MRDIYSIEDGQDLIIRDSTVPKAANVLGTQVGSLEYAKSFGVDNNYFLQPNLEFQNESYKTYIVSRLAEHQVNVTEAIDLIQDLGNEITYKVSNENKEGLIS